MNKIILVMVVLIFLVLQSCTGDKNILIGEWTEIETILSKLKKTAKYELVFAKDHMQYKVTAKGKEIKKKLPVEYKVKTKQWVQLYSNGDKMNVKIINNNLIQLAFSGSLPKKFKRKED